MRKVLLMSVFLLFNHVFAVLMATLLTIFSLSIHIAARPFEDKGTDWTEMLSLCAQLITLVAGLVFIILVRISRQDYRAFGLALIACVSPCVVFVQNDPESGMDPAMASSVRDALELVGGITLLVALGASLLVQVDVWRAVRSNGDEDEHDDFKIRTEERRLEDMKRAVEEQQIVIAKLKEARSVLLKEKADVKAMHDHTHGDEDQARQSRPHSDDDRLTIENPLHE